MPDYDDRKKLLESLKNRLEALLSPKLITSFNEHNTSEGGREGEREDGGREGGREGGRMVYYFAISMLWTS